MQVIALPVFMTLLSAVAASPLQGIPNALIPRVDYTIGFGQQIQTSDETNRWVVWTEGKTPCDDHVTLPMKLTESPCNYAFILNGNWYTLINCNGNNIPQDVQKSGGSSSCDVDDKKITCSGSTHDVVKHAKCI